jgi:hypothetical protein
MRPVSPRSRPTSEELAGQDAVFTVEVKEVRLSGLGRGGAISAANRDTQAWAKEPAQPESRRAA